MLLETGDDNLQSITLYSTGCPQCGVLKSELDKKGVTYEICSDVRFMRSIGILSVPVLGVDGALMGMKDALSWLKGLAD